MIGQNNIAIGITNGQHLITGSSNIAVGVNSLGIIIQNNFNPFLFIILGEINRTKSDILTNDSYSHYAVLDYFHDKVYHIATPKPVVGILDEFYLTFRQKYYHNIPSFNSGGFNYSFDRAFKQYHLYMPKYIMLFLAVKEIFGNQSYDIIRYLSQYYVAAIKI